jgi:beta-glucanase (GH16 family)
MKTRVFGILVLCAALCAPLCRCFAGAHEEAQSVLPSGTALPGAKVARTLVSGSGPAKEGGGGHANFPPSDFVLKFEEEFSKPFLDTNVWSTSLKVFGRWGDRHHNDSYLNYLSDEDVLLGNGLLRLRSEMRTVEGDNPPGAYDYSSGMVSSHDKFSFLYGYIEIRAKFPGGPGVWPAFWLMPQSHQWPPEFDIAEYYAGRKLMHLGLCYGDFPEINWDSGGNNDVPFESGWHTYGLLWMPGFAVWTQDGIAKREVRGAYVPSIPMYIILSNGVSSRIGPSGEPDGTTVFPNFFEVDSVRVWQMPEAVPGSAK